VLSQQLAETLLNNLPNNEDGNGDKEPEPGDHPARRERLPIDAQDIDGRCELGNGTPIHPRWALHTMAAATLRRLVLTTENEATNLSRKIRSFPPHLKLALLAAARGRCQINGCDAPVPWLEADHVHPWNHQGETDIARNGQILCSHHNKAKRDSLPQEQPPQKKPPDTEPPEKGQLDE